MSTLSVNTITAETGNTVSLASGKTLDASQGFVPPAGHVIQTLTDVSVITESTTTKASDNSFANSSLSITITPKSASSKIIVNAVASTGSSNGADGSTIVRMIRDSTPIGIGNASGSKIRAGSGRGTNNQDGNTMLNIPLQVTDTPNTTSAVTYTLQYAVRGAGTQTAYLNRSGGDADSAEYQRTSSSLVVQEIAG
jgi:hypothetical protein